MLRTAETFSTPHTDGRNQGARRMNSARRLWSRMWLGIFLIGLGTLFYLDSLPAYKGKIFFPGFLILIGILYSSSSATSYDTPHKTDKHRTMNGEARLPIGLTLY